MNKKLKYCFARGGQMSFSSKRHSCINCQHARMTEFRKTVFHAPGIQGYSCIYSRRVTVIVKSHQYTAITIRGRVLSPSKLTLCTDGFWPDPHLCLHDYYSFDARLCTHGIMFTSIVISSKAIFAWILIWPSSLLHGHWFDTSLIAWILIWHSSLLQRYWFDIRLYCTDTDLTLVFTAQILISSESICMDTD